MRRLEALLAAEGIDVEVRATRTLEEGLRAARELATEDAVLVPAGGDGTLLSVIAAALERSCPVCPLPLGTANDLAAHLAIRTPEDVARAIRAGRERALEVVVARFETSAGARELPFCSTAGVGILAEVMAMEARPSVTRLKGVLGNAAWPLLFTVAAVTRTEPEAVITVDGASVRRPLAMLELGKVPRAGGFLFHPDAATDSGMLHFFFFGDVSSNAAFTYHAARIVLGSGRHVEHPELEYVGRDPETNSLGASACTEVLVETDAPMPVHLQGELVGSTPVRFTLDPRRLRVLTP